jgi:hypothetical protein
MALIEDVTTAAERNYMDWKRQARFYGTVSSVVRILLIISTAVVAAEKTFQPHLPQSLTALFPTLSLLVAIGTALDAWLKPRDKWKGFLSDRDAAHYILIRARNSENDDARAAALLDELRVIEQRHIEKNVY